MITKEEFEYRVENGIDTTVKWTENNYTYKGCVVECISEDIDIGFGEGYVRFIKMEHFKVMQFYNEKFRRFKPLELSFMYDVTDHKANDLYEIWGGSE